MKFRFKNLYPVALLSVALLSYASCNKDKLDVAPPTPSEVSYFTSENEFRAAAIGAYAVLTDYYSSSNIAGGSGNAELELFFLPGDDLTAASDGPFEVFGNGMNSSNSKLNQIFASSYIMINRANKVLEKIETVSNGIYTTPNLKNYNKGEMLFLRGFANYMLWNVFGTAPVVLAIPKEEGQINTPGSTGNQLLDQAITDFTTAAGLLPAYWGAAEMGRVTANAANGMLGKCLVFRGTVNKSATDYQAAVTAFNKITGASLTANFEDNFDVNKENNSESLFEFQSGKNINGGFTNSWLGNDQADIGVASAYYYMYSGSWQNYMGGGQFRATNKLKNSFNPMDPRLPLTLDVTNNDITRYVLKDQTEGPANSLNNHRILRYADVLLLKAEATLQSGTASDAIGLINQVRTRARNMVAGGTEPANFNVAETNKTTIMQWLMDERFRELAGEGQRWFDLRRWSIGGAITLDNSFFSSLNPTKMTWDKHYLYFPIPNSETDKNPNIKQNEGY